MPQGLYVRAVAIFSDPPEAATKPVLRCPVHRQSTTDPVNIGKFIKFSLHYTVYFIY